MVDIKQIQKEDLSDSYLISQAEGLKFEFEKLKREGLASDGYIIEKIMNIIRFLSDIDFKGIDYLFKDIIELKKALLKEREKRNIC